MKKKIKKYFPDAGDNLIVLDTNYSPVKLVNPKVEEVVVSLTKKEEKLTLTIETSGALEPRQALQQALEVSQNSFNHISQLISDNISSKKRKKEELTSEPTPTEVKKVKI